MVLAIDALDAAIDVSGVEDTISNAKHALEAAKTSLQVIQPIQEALLSKIVDPKRQRRRRFVDDYSQN